MGRSRSTPVTEDQQARHLAAVLVGDERPQVANAVKKARSTLPEMTRRAIDLTLADGLTLKEASGVLGVSVPHVQQLRRRGLSGIAASARCHSDPAADRLETVLTDGEVERLQEMGFERLSEAVWSSQEMPTQRISALMGLHRRRAIKRLRSEEPPAVDPLAPPPPKVDIRAVDAYFRSEFGGLSLRDLAEVYQVSHTQMARLRDAGREVLREHFGVSNSPSIAELDHLPIEPATRTALGRCGWTMQQLIDGGAPLVWTVRGIGRRGLADFALALAREGVVLHGLEDRISDSDIEAVMVAAGAARASREGTADAV